ncbi:hypothetical protein [Paludibaculum fermentans]|uniref:hypothetical protein n=1 Tax=Paludibaculum fermentans TaxID=1473598 RepID=UPI003EB78A77
MNKLKTLFFASALAIASLTPIYAKSYDFSLSAPVNAGTVKLEPGRYTVKVDGTSATLILAKNNKTIEVPMKVAEGTTKFKTTAVNTKQGGSAVELTSIDLGGSKMKVEFSN